VDVRIFDAGERFCLAFGSSDEVAELFEEIGLQGGGHTWSSVLEVLLENQMPSAMNVVQIDAEADEVSVFAREREILETIGKMVQALAADRERLMQLVEQAGDRIE
jgi:hypothetical protein